MTKCPYRELVFGISEDTNGGYVAECLSESIVTLGQYLN
jgi:hypothetical protein